MARELTKKPSMPFLLNCEYVVTHTTAKQASLSLAADTGTDCKLQHGFWGQHILPKFLRRLNPENETFFISDTLLLRVRVIVWLGSKSDKLHADAHHFA